MLEELRSIRKHQVADIVPACFVPPNNNINSTRRVFKFKADGRFQARLLVQDWGYRHRLETAGVHLHPSAGSKVYWQMPQPKSGPTLAPDVKIIAFSKGKE